MKAADVSILIPTKNGYPNIQQLFDRIQTQSTEKEIETVVIDSGSTDGTKAVVNERADVIVEIPPEEFHHARTRNLAAEHATGDIFVFLTQDALPADNMWLSRLIAPLSEPNVGVAYGRQIATEDAKPMEKFFYSYFYPDETRTIDESATTDERGFYLDHVYISDVCSAMKRTVWESTQFKQDVGMSEDKEFALRVLRDGYKIVYESNALVRHSHDYSLRSLFSRRFKDGTAFANIASTGDDTFLSSGMAYLLAELRFLFREGYIAWIPYALLYDAVYYIAFQCGKITGQLRGE